MSNYYCRMALYSGYQNELMHTGKLGMHWGVRHYQPYSVGYQSQNGGIYVGPRTGVGRLFGGLFGKAKNSSIGRGVSQSISDLSKKGFSKSMQDGFSVLRDAFGPDIKKGVSSIKSKTGDAATSIGARFLSSYLGSGTTRKQDIITPRQALEGAKRSLREFGVDLGKGIDSLKSKSGNVTSSIGASFLSMYLGSGDSKKSKYGAGLSSIIGKQNSGSGSVLERINQASGKSSARILSDLLSSGRTPATLSEINQGSGNKFKGFNIGLQPKDMDIEFAPYRNSGLRDLSEHTPHKYDNSVNTYIKKEAMKRYERLLGNELYLKQLRDGLI